MANPNWVKGVSGNPTGRAAGYAAFQEACRRHDLDAVKRMAAIVLASDSKDNDAIAAASLLLAYAHGKPASAPEDLEAAKAQRPLSESAAADLVAYLQARKSGK